jgi:hypothetical protein
MRSLNEHLNESTTSKDDRVAMINDMFSKEIQEIKDSFYKIFPKGYLYISWRLQIGSPHLSISYRLIDDLKTTGITYQENDPMFGGFMGFLKTSDYNYNPTKEDKIELTTGGSGSGIYIKPEPGSYYAMQRIKVPFRKTTAPMDKLVKNLKDHFTKLGKTVKDNKDNFMDNIPREYIDSVKP